MERNILKELAEKKPELFQKKSFEDTKKKIGLLEESMSSSTEDSQKETASSSGQEKSSYRQQDYEIKSRNKQLAEIGRKVLLDEFSILSIINKNLERKEKRKIDIQEILNNDTDDVVILLHKCLTMLEIMSADIEWESHSVELLRENLNRLDVLFMEMQEVEK